MSATKNGGGADNTHRHIKAEQYKDNLGFMYDSMTLRGFTDNPNAIISYLPAKRHRQRFTGTMSHHVNLKNLKIEIIDNGYLYIRGSLATYLLGHNICGLSPSEHLSALKEISNAIGIDISTFNVRKLEMNLTIPVTLPAYQYLEVFRDYVNNRKSIRFSEFSDSVYYVFNKYRKLIVYDKTQELKAKGIQTDINLLRIELKESKNLERVMGNICVMDLYRPDVLSIAQNNLKKYINGLTINDRGNRKERTSEINNLLKFSRWNN